MRVKVALMGGVVGLVALLGGGIQAAGADAQAGLDRAQQALDGQRYSEAEAEAARAADLCAAARDEACQGRALLLRGAALVRMGRCKEAAPLLDGAIAALRGDALASPRAGALVWRAEAARILGEPDAERWASQALDTYRGLGDAAGEARALLTLGDLKMRRGQIPAATERYDQAQAVLSAHPDPVVQADLWWRQGQVQIRQGRFAEAETLYGQALDAYRAVGHTRGQAEAQRALGDAARLQSRLDAALDLYGRALQGYTTCGDLIGQARTGKSQGEVYSLQGKLDAAAEAFEVARTRFEVAGDALGQANATRSIGEIAYLRSDLPRAEQSYDAAIAQYLALGDPMGLAYARLQLGNVRVWQSRLDDAQELYQQALDAYVAAKNVQGEANALNLLGCALAWQGELDAARADLQRALELYQGLGDGLGQANTLRVLGDMLRTQGDLDAAERTLTQALEGFTAIGAVKGAADVQRDLGELYQVQGRLDEAMDALERSAVGYASLGDPQGNANATWTLGTVRFLQGKLDSAADQFLAAIEAYTAAENPVGLALAQQGLGDVRALQGRAAEAETLYARTIEEQRRFGQPCAIASTYNRWGALKFRAGQVKEARAMYSDALKLCTADGNVLNVADALAGLCRVRGAEGTREEALQVCGEALAAYDRGGDRGGVAEVHLLLATLWRDLGDLDRAWLEAEQTQRIHEAILGGLGEGSSALAYAERHADELDELVSIGVTTGHLEDALRLTLTLQGRGLLWSRGLARARAATSADVEEILQQRREASTEVGRGSAALLDAAPPSPAPFVALREARQRLDDADRRLWLALDMTPEQTALPTIPELQQALRDDPRRPVLAVYSDRGDTTRVWVLDGQTTRVWTLAEDAALGSAGRPTRSDIRRLGDALVQPLRRAGGARDETARAAALASFSPSAAVRLYDVLVRPWEGALACDPGPCRPLLVVPDGWLHPVPFQALIRTPAPGADLSLDPMAALKTAVFLGHQTPVSTLPTPGLLLTRFQTPAATSGALVLGSPAGAGLGPAERKEVATAWRRLRGLCQEPGRCPDGPLTDTAATAAALEDWLPRVAVAYISGHGLYEEIARPEGAEPLGMSLLLLADAVAPPEVASKGVGSERPLAVKGLARPTLADKGGRAALRCSAEGDDNCVFPEEIQPRFLAADLVVLSACASALGDRTVTEGFTGVSRALLTAGTNTVVSAAWPVATAQTRDWMDVFTRARFVDGLPTADALLQARRSLHGDTTVSGRTIPLEHPFFWAGFTLYGYDGPAR